VPGERRITLRQLEVLDLIADGLTNKEIGERLAISPRTAKAHADALRERLDVKKRRLIPAAYRAYVRSLGAGDPAGG
jgi:DNA-binding CsgD family transcriptional regulator